jgi:hypothetical protein
VFHAIMCAKICSMCDGAIYIVFSLKLYSDVTDINLFLLLHKNNLLKQ